MKHRELLVGKRTAAINALRGHAAEFGVIAAKGTANVEALLAVLAEHIAELDAQIAAMDKQLLEQHKSNPVWKASAALVTMNFGLMIRPIALSRR